MPTIRAIGVALVAAFVGARSAYALPPTAAAVDDALRTLERATATALDVKRSAATGVATFVTAKPNAPMVLPIPAALTATERALAFVRIGGAAFALPDAAHVRVRGVEGPDELGTEHVRLQQQVNDVPVTGAELVVHLRGNAVLAANGTTLPSTDAVDTVPTIPAEAATEEARRIATDELAVPDAALSEPRLEVLDPGLLEGAPSGAHLTWYVEASAVGLREGIWIDAHEGDVVLRLDRVADGKNRRIFDAFHTTTGVLVRSEGQPATGDADADAAYDHAGDAYDYFATQHNRDGFDGFGSRLDSFVHVCVGPCPYRNASWDGTKIVYGDGYPRADDVVAHEVTHAVTEYSASLFYCQQSGALNESFSDIFGETVDLTNSRGTDTSGVRWQIGEDEPNGGALRNMKVPSVFGQPGRVHDPQYLCVNGCASDTDNGGVHVNSGVLNHAYVLMVDGGSYNGITVTGIGLTKAAKIHYRALIIYLGPFSLLVDAYDALNQSCADLVGGVAGITAGDCSNVRKALEAVELDQPPCQPPPTPTSSLTPPPTQSPTPTLSATPTPTITPTPLALPDPLRAKAAAKCQQTIAKTAAKAVGERLRILGTCADAALACVQSKAGRPECLGKAAALCDKKIAALSVSTQKRRGAILKSCVAVGLNELRIPTGLGYDALAAPCLESPDAITDCVLGLHACAGDRLFATELPRAGALVEGTGLASARLDELACLPRGTDGTGGAGPLAGAVERCAAAIQKAGRTLVASDLAVLGKCTSTIFVCEQTKSAQFASCVQKAAPKCQKGVLGLASARAKVLVKIQDACGALPFESLKAVTGADLDALTADCAARGVALGSIADYAECLARQHECEADQLLHAEVPRADQLLERVGLDGVFPNVSCPGTTLAPNHPAVGPRLTTSCAANARP